MQNAETLLTVIRERGKRGMPLERIYRMLFNPELYRMAYARLYSNPGAMTRGVTTETVDGMSQARMERLIAELRKEKFRWSPVRRTYIPKSNGKRRPIGIPTWRDKLLQEVIRLILDAYYEPQFSDRSHGFRPQHGCHTALGQLRQYWLGTKWFIEGDIESFFDNIDHNVLMDILSEKLHDNRFLRLLKHLLQAGYLEDWRFKRTLSGTPQGGVLSPLLSNIYLDRLDKYVEEVLIPDHTRGEKRAENPAYKAARYQVSRWRKEGNREKARQYQKIQQSLPSQDPNDPDFRRLRYCRYADDFLLGYVGARQEAEAIKQQIGTFLRDKLKLRLSQEKTLVTHATSGSARFLGYDVHILQADDKHTHGWRSINGQVGLRVPHDLIPRKSAFYMKNGKSIHLPQRLADSDYSIITQYQREYRGIVQYYLMAYNVNCLQRLRWVMEQSLIKTLARKYRSTVVKMYAKYGSTVQTSYGPLNCLATTVEREDRPPLVARFGGIPLRHKDHTVIRDKLPKPINTRTEIVQRMLADHCELCGSTRQVEVHHVRKMADLNRRDRLPLPEWKQIMITRQRKSLVVCRACHEAIHAG